VVEKEPFKDQESAFLLNGEEMSVHQTNRFEQKFAIHRNASNSGISKKAKKKLRIFVYFSKYY